MNLIQYKNIIKKSTLYLIIISYPLILTPPSAAPNPPITKNSHQLQCHEAPFISKSEYGSIYSAFPTNIYLNYYPK